QQRLVGGDHMLALGDGLEDAVARQGLAAHQLDDDVDVRVSRQRHAVGGDGHVGTDQRTRLGDIAHGHGSDLDAAPRPPGDLAAVLGQHRPDTAAYDAQTPQTYTDRFHFSSPSLRNMSLMPRTAWRVRCSFSMRAKRTYSSPYSPKPTPGDTATLASASRRLENSSEPSARQGSGMCAQMYMEALGMSTIQPASCRPRASTSRRLRYCSTTSETQSCGPSRAAMAATWMGVNVP